MFSFSGIKYTVGNDRTVVLSGTVGEGEVLIIQGASGAGKSTLLRILSRLQACSAGDVLLHNVNWLEFTGPAWRAAVHYLAQKPAVFEGSVLENLTAPFKLDIFVQKSFEFPKVKELFGELLLPHALLEQDAKTLSGGELSRMAFVRALIVSPQVLLLDEPTAALDEKAREAFYRLLNHWLLLPGHAALLVSHTDDYQCLSDKFRILDIEV